MYPTMSFYRTNYTYIIIAYDYYVFGFVCVQQFVDYFVRLPVCAEYHAVRLHIKWIIANHFLFQFSTAVSLP